MTGPILRHVASRWSMVDYPSRKKEWSYDRKLADAKAAGFDAIATAAIPEVGRAAKKHGLTVLGYFSSGKQSEFAGELKANKKIGAHHINVQLADEDTLTPEALGLALLLMQEGKSMGLAPAVEMHRDTCTETPEKAYALADAYLRVTGELLPITWDFSHFAIVKHLHPGNYAEKLLVRPDLIQRAQMFHFRPFNGHHCQIPATDGNGKLTPELKDWLPFAEALLKCWLDGNRNTNRELFVCPEMGPVASGYNLSTLPNSWEDAKVVRLEIDKIWKKLTTKRR